MAVVLRVTVAGEVLETRKYVLGLHAFQIGHRHPSHRFRLLSKGSDVDDRVAGIVVDVGHGRTDQSKTDCPGLTSGNATGFPGKMCVAGGADGHG